MLSKIVLLSLVAISAADYRCFCNYDPSAIVYSTTSSSSTQIGHLNEFDCKPTYTGVTVSASWVAIQFEQQVRRRKI